MYCSRPVQRSPSAIRIISRAPRQCRQASYYPSSGFSISPFYARPTAPLDPFRGFERLLEDIASPSFPFGFPQQLQHLQQQQQQQQQLAHQQQARTFAPRFDVQEQTEAYELRGEIPGVEAKDLEVEFRDAQTLVIRGRTEAESSSGTPPAPASAQAEQTVAGNGGETGIEAAETAPETDQSDAASVHSTGSYQKPTVEDATEPAAEGTDAASAVSEAQATRATTPGAEAQQVQAQAPQASQAPQQQQQQSHYWISERSTGSFQRVFKFPQRVDQKGVTASLKNGILRVVVPKAGVPEVRRIVVE